MTELPIHASKTGYLVKLTDEQRAMGMQVWPVRILSPEEQAAAKLLRAKEAAQARIEVEQRLAKAHPALQPVIAHHSPEEQDFLFHWTCKGCDEGSYADDSPVWPCSTIDLILETVGPPETPCPTHWMDGRNEVRCWAGVAGHPGECR